MLLEAISVMFTNTGTHDSAGAGGEPDCVKPLWELGLLGTI